MGANEFFSNEDPMDAEEWLVHMENIFKVFKCSGRQKPALVAYMFRGVVDSMWKTVKIPYLTIDHAVAWETFLN